MKVDLPRQHPAPLVPSIFRALSTSRQNFEGPDELLNIHVFVLIKFGDLSSNAYSVFHFLAFTPVFLVLLSLQLTFSSINFLPYLLQPFLYFAAFLFFLLDFFTTSDVTSDKRLAIEGAISMKDFEEVVIESHSLFTTRGQIV